MTERKPATPAEAFITAKLREFLAPGSEYGAGAILLAYRRPDDTSGGCNIAGVIGINPSRPIEELAPELTHLVERLRSIADEVEAMMKRGGG
jgi:hypothetical protein